MINKAKIDLDDALLKRKKLTHREKSKSKTARGVYPVVAAKSPVVQQPNFNEALESHGENLRTTVNTAESVINCNLEIPLSQV